MKNAAGHARARRRAAAREGGFTLIELLITLLVVAEIMIIAGLIFDLHNKTARAQGQVADMQQSLRVGQREIIDLVRMAGRGGLPAHLAPADAPGPMQMNQGLAVEVENNVAAGTTIVTNDDTTAVVPGTDVLRVRGIFSAPLYQLLNVALGGPNVIYEPGAEDPATAVAGTLTVGDPSPSGYRQDLQPLADAVEHDALILVSPLSDAIYGVVSVETVTVTAQDGDGNPLQVSVRFRVTGGDYTANYRGLYAGAGNLPSNLNSVAFLGLLEEHVFYVRDVPAIPGDPSSESMPRLSRAQVFPRTGVQVAAGAGRNDVADNVVDLQVALGFNSSLGVDGYFDREQLDELVLNETGDGAADDWLFNGAGDDPSQAPWVGPWADPPLGTPQPELYYVRVTTLARTEGREFQYISPAIPSLEDRAYNEATVPAGRDPDREFHRRLLRTVIDLRSL